MTVYKLEEKIESLKRGIRLEELNTRNIEKKIPQADLCRRYNLINDIEISKAIIKNAKERIEILDKTW